MTHHHTEAKNHFLKKRGSLTESLKVTEPHHMFCGTPVEEHWSRSQFFQPTLLDPHIFSPKTAQINFFRKDPVFEYSGGRRSAKTGSKG